MAARPRARNALTLLRASAGSGKTHALVLRYLVLALAQPEQFRRILALTFTNKATAEMKRRMVEATAALAQGEHRMLPQLQQALPGLNVPTQAKALLAHLLHHYSWMAVQTIDRFFLRVVRGFARELQLELGAEVDIDTDTALSAAVDHLMARVGREPELTDWLARYALSQLQEDKGWNVERALRKLGEELFGERLEGVPGLGPVDTTDGPAALSIAQVGALLDAIADRREAYREAQTAVGRKALALMEMYSLSVDSFTQKSRGVGGYLAALANGEADKEVKSYTREALANAEAWATKTSSERAAILDAVNGGLGELLAQAIARYDAESSFLTAAKDVFRYGHALPLLPALAEGLKDYRERHGVVLLNDVAAMLDVVLKGAETSFVYEKLGVRYQHLLLDEFQDTSRRQWRNLHPLAEEALASGHSVLVVGDPKQSIYRFRSGDPRLLLELPNDFPRLQALIETAELGSNYRSAHEVVRFNNAVFTEAHRLLSERMDAPPLLEAAYGSGIVQAAEQQQSGGRVDIRFIAATEEHTFAELALERLLHEVNALAAAGYSHADIAVLVRTNSEGRTAADALIRAGVPVVSAESLLVASSPRVQVLLSALELLVNPAADVAQAHLQRWAQQQPDQAADVLPRLLARRRQRLAATLHELVADLQGLLLGGAPDAFVLAFAQAVNDYARTEGGDAAGFLQWWAGQAHKRSIQAPEGADAVRILTFHKAKGLEFPVVILPWVDWSLSRSERTILWTRPQVAPFDQVPVLPVAGINKPAEASDPFAPERNEEFQAALVDSLNLLYVGFTRAVQVLLAFAPVPKRTKPDALSGMGDMLYDVLSAPAWQSHISIEGADRVLRIGAGGPASKSLRPPAHSAAGPEDYARQPEPMAVLRVRRRASVYAEWMDSRRQGPLRWGQVIHAVLQRLEQPEALPAALAALEHEGVIGAAEASEAKRAVEQLIGAPAAAVAFEQGWRVLTESELLLDDGTRLRPDRVLIREQAVRIVEFKTTPEALQAAAQAEHVQQLGRYTQAARAMGYPHVEGYLLYLAPARVVALHG